MTTSDARESDRDWRVPFLWRFLGYVLTSLMVLVLADVPDLAPSLFAGAAAGLALLAFGGRPSVLAVATLAVGWILWDLISRRYPYQLAEEYLLLFVLPLAGLILSIWAQRRPGSNDASAESDEAQLALFRCLLIVVMSFAALHKLNADFLDPAVSCATEHARSLLGLLPPSPRLRAAIPTLALVGEALVPLLLVFAPRLGVAYGVGLMAYVGHQGATPFTLLVMLMSTAFLTRQDGIRILAGYQDSRWLVVGLHVWALVTASMILVGLGGWSRYGLWIVALLNLAIALRFALGPDVKELRTALRGGSWRALVPSRARLMPRERGARVFLIVLLALTSANALTPYLGLKLRLSFAMFSNLRVDDARQNSLWVSPKLRLAEHDSFVHVTSVSGPLRDAFLIGLYTPESLTKVLTKVGQVGGRLQLTLRHAGEERQSRNAAFDAELRAWLESLPSGVWFQSYLPAEGPQSCLH